MLISTPFSYQKSCNSNEAHLGIENLVLCDGEMEKPIINNKKIDDSGKVGGNIFSKPLSIMIVMNDETEGTTREKLA